MLRRDGDEAAGWREMEMKMGLLRGDGVDPGDLRMWEIGTRGEGFKGKRVLSPGTLFPRSRGISLPYPSDGPCDLAQAGSGLGVWAWFGSG